MAGRFPTPVRKQIALGDWRSIKEFDVVADALIQYYPELACDVSPADKLWEIVSADFVPTPPAEEFERQALEMINSCQKVEPCGLEY